jgi:hypothetical protein
MNTRQYRVRGTALVVLIVTLCFAVPKATADIREDFSFWITLESIERIGEGTSALTGRVAGLPVRILLNDTTTVHDAAGQPVDPYAIGVGAIVLVRADWGREGLIARAVSVSNEDEMVMTGVLEYASADRIRVSNTDLRRSELTSLDPLASPGQLVVARIRFDPDGGMTAINLQAQPSLRLYGRISRVQKTGATEGIVQVASKSVRVTQSAVLLAAGDVKLSFDDLKEGQYVDLSGEISNGLVTARKILVSNPQEVIITGKITAFNSKSVSVKGEEGICIIRMDPHTEVLGTLALNAPVGIRTVLQGDSSLLAARIMVSERTAGMNSVRGVIASLGNGFFMVGAVKVSVNAQTVIISKEGTLSFADLKVGDQVAAVGSKQPDGSLLAAKVEVSRPQLVLGNVQGTIASLGNSFFMVGAVQVSVSAQTVIISKGRTLSFSDLKVGDQVYAAGTKQADGSLLAAKIEVYTPAPVISTVRGAIAALGNGFFMVGSVRVSIGAQTVIVSKGKTLSFADLKVGDQVAAVGSKQPDGSLAATKIEVAVPVLAVSTVQGTITSLGNSFFMVGSAKIYVSTETKILFQGRTLSFGELKIGDQVFAAGNKQPDGSLQAIKIEVAASKR